MLWSSGALPILLFFHNILLSNVQSALAQLCPAVSSVFEPFDQSEESHIYNYPTTTSSSISDTCSANAIMSTDQDEEGPVQVYIMLGQSNMLGFGAVGPPDKPGTLRNLVEQQGKYPHLKNSNNNDDDLLEWTQLPTVRYVHVMQHKQQMEVKHNEWLTIQKGQRHFGPELGFGHVLGPAMSQTKRKGQILLLKACIGNRSLGWDLLPPGSPSFEHRDDGNIYAGYKESPNFWKKGTTPKPIGWYAGKQYDDDTAMCKEILDNLPNYYPGAKNNKDYEVVGFVWWQGHKDGNAALASRYEQNLVRLIHSLRNDFNAPHAKFVCATVGFDGVNLKGHLLTVADAQLAVSGETGKYPEFEGNVKTIDARPYWRDKEQSPVGQHHHYNQNAETFYEVGRALGEAMLELLQDSS